MTYDDFVRGTGEQIQDVIRGWEGTFGFNVRFINSNGEKTKLSNRSFWGFIYKGHFLRTKGYELAMLVDTGKINFWINGYAGLGMLWHPNDNTAGSFLAGESECFLSVGSGNAKLYSMPTQPHVKKDFKEFCRDYPQFDEVTSAMDIWDLGGIYVSV